jgi:hypothetical protein
VPKTISHESALGRWEMVLARPERDLRPYVRSYCGYDEETVAFSRRRELERRHRRRRSSRAPPTLRSRRLLRQPAVPVPTWPGPGGGFARRRVASAWANSRRSFAVGDGTSALASPSSLDYRPRRSRGSFGLGVRRASSAPAQLRSPSATKRQIGSAWPRSPLSAATTTRLTSTAIFGSSRGSRPHNSKRCCCRIRAA